MQIIVNLAFGCLFDLRSFISKVSHKRVSCFRSIDFALLFHRELFVGCSYFNSLTLKSRTTFESFSFVGLSRNIEKEVQKALNENFYENKMYKETHIIRSFNASRSMLHDSISSFIFFRIGINFSHFSKKKKNGKDNCILTEILIFRNSRAG